MEHWGPAVNYGVHGLILGAHREAPFGFPQGFDGLVMFVGIVES